MKHLFIAISVVAVAFFGFGAVGSVSAQECVQYCGNPPDGIGGGGGETGGSDSLDWWQYIGDDADGDGRDDVNDNCVWVPNLDQEDADGDGVGDACDNCPATFNQDQADANNDGSGDACSSDDDGDGVLDGPDNCNLVANPNQLDSDSDGSGNACDGFCIEYPNHDDCKGLDTDDDDILDTLDLCPTVSDTSNADADGDGLGDVCDTDDDNDGIADNVDNCPGVANEDQADGDRDMIGDVCDANANCFVVHRDAEGVLDPTAPCLDPDDPLTAYIVAYPHKPEKGDDLELTVAINRADLKSKITFYPEGFPGSKAPSFDPANVVEVSNTDYYTYHINYEALAKLLDLRKGTYTIRMDLELLDPDPEGFDKITTSDTLSIEVQEGEGGGCSIGTEAKPSVAIMLQALLLLGLFYLRRRKK